MTREEQMWQAVEEEHGPLLPRESFITLTAMEWADKTRIEKTISWMREQVYQEYGGGPFERLIPDERIEDFRETMLKEYGEL